MASFKYATYWLRKPSTQLGFLLWTGPCLYVGFIAWQMGWTRFAPIFTLDKAQWVVLTGIVLASVGWIFSARVTVLNSVRQHTITTLLQSRSSELFQKHSAELSARYSAGPKLIVLTRDELDSNDQKAVLGTLRYLLNYLEFIAVAIRLGDLDERLMRQTLRGMFCSTFEIAKVLIDFKREPVVLRVSKKVVVPKTYEHIVWLYGLWYDPDLEVEKVPRPPAPPAPKPAGSWISRLFNALSS